MASILILTAKGVTKQEVNGNLQTIGNFMQFNQRIFQSVVFPNFNPIIYYSPTTVITKEIHDIVNALKNDKKINQAIKSIEYAGHLNKM